MRTSPRLIEERLVWFWHDHFATSLAKVRVPYLLAQQHATEAAVAGGAPVVAHELMGRLLAPL